jgi:hypothetical protein
MHIRRRDDVDVPFFTTRTKNWETAKIGGVFFKQEGRAKASSTKLRVSRRASSRGLGETGGLQEGAKLASPRPVYGERTEVRGCATQAGLYLQSIICRWVY